MTPYVQRYKTILTTIVWSLFAAIFFRDTGLFVLASLPFNIYCHRLKGEKCKYWNIEYLRNTFVTKPNYFPLVADKGEGLTLAMRQLISPKFLWFINLCLDLSADDVCLKGAPFMVMKYCLFFLTELLEKKDREGTVFHCARQDIKLALPPKRYLNPRMGNQ